jgi:adenylate cyclase
MSRRSERTVGPPTVERLLRRASLTHRRAHDDVGAPVLRARVENPAVLRTREGRTAGRAVVDFWRSVSARVLALASPATALSFDLARRFRLGSGAILWTYITFHFVNHAFGIVSLDAAEGALRVAAAVWQSWPGTILLYGAFFTHVTLAFLSLHQRHTLALPPLELARIAFGLTIPWLLIGHVVATRVAFSWYGQTPEYARVIANLSRDGMTGWQLALLAPGWIHGCMGLNLGFRHLAWYQRSRRYFIGLVVALPLLATAGYGMMLRDVEALGVPQVLQAVPDKAPRGVLGSLRVDLLVGYFGLLGLVLVSRLPRDWRRLREARASSDASQS